MQQVEAAGQELQRDDGGEDPCRPCRLPPAGVYAAQYGHQQGLKAVGGAEVRFGGVDPADHNDAGDGGDQGRSSHRW